jgi:Fe-S oxidoreductase
MCCGRPLYDWGMLEDARAHLQEILAQLRDSIDGGIPVVVLEPSCASVFRDELTGMLPHDERAKRLSGQTFLLSEFLQRYAPDAHFPALHRRALVHGHCHHKSVMKMDAELRLLQQLGLDMDTPDSGCCGMAGAFGFESQHYDVAMKIGERVLLPAVRRASKDTLIVSDGFSCHEQIAQSTDREPLHLAEVLDMAMAQSVRAPLEEYPERAYVPPHVRDEPLPSRSAAALALIAAGLVGAAAAAVRATRRA